MKARDLIQILLISVILALVFALPVNAAYLQGDGEVIYEEPPVDEYIHPPDIYIPPQPPPRIMPPLYNHYYDFVSSLILTSSRPQNYDGLKIFFITSNDRYRIQSRSILTLDEAYTRGLIRIDEHAGGTVSQVSVTSYTGSYIFLMAGEIVSGGRQTRTIVKDFLVPPRSRNIVVDVYCVEEGRWDDGGRVFRPAEPMVDYSLRGKVLREEGQSEIWSGIREQEKRAGIPAENHNLLEYYSKSRRDPGLDQKMYRIRRAIPYNAVGMVITRKNRILGIEAFYSHDMFAREFNKLFRSYYYTEVPGWFYRSVDSSDVRRLLKRLKSANVYRDNGYRGAGRLYDVSVGGYYGGTLDFGGVLHLSLIK